MTFAINMKLCSYILKAVPITISPQKYFWYPQYVRYQRLKNSSVYYSLKQMIYPNLKVKFVYKIPIQKSQMRTISLEYD